MDPNKDPYAALDKNQPINDAEYRPKTIFSEPQGIAPPMQPPVNPAVVYGATPSATQPPVTPSANAPSKKGLFIALGIAGAVVVVLGIVVAIVLVSGSGNDKESTDKKSQASTLQPATDIELEQINNSISQDVSGIDDEKDYPANALEEKTLGL